MRRFFLLLSIGAFVSGCASQNSRNFAPPATGVFAPPKSESVDVSPVFNGVSGVRDSVDRTYQVVRDLGSKLDHASLESTKALDSAQSAFDKGVQAGSEAAKILRDHVAQVNGELASTKQEKDKLGGELESSRKELSLLSIEVGKLTVSLTKMEAETLSLRASLNEANTRIESSAKAVTALQESVAKSDAVIANKSKWVWRWACSFFLLLALNVVFVAGKLQGWSFLPRL
jgi:hypothetical protein